MNLADKLREFRSGSIEQENSESSNLNSKVLLIDGLNTFIRMFAATPTMNDDGDHIGGTTGFLLNLASTIRFLKPSRVVIVFDGVGGSVRRRQIFDGYKSGRKTMTKLNRTYDFQTLEEEERSRKMQLSLLATMLRCLPVTIIAQDNVEADDVLAYLAQTVELRGGKSVIFSNDKDFLQLINENTSVYNPVKKKMYRPDKVVEDYGFHPNNFLVYRAITGDVSDCIPGVEGIKEKTLLKLFPQLVTEQKYDIDALLSEANTIIQNTKKPSVALQTFAASKDILDRNIKLMRLDDVAMSGQTRISVVEQFDRPINRLNKLELTKLVRLNKLGNAFGRWDEWVQSSFMPLMRFTLSGMNND
jgi:DNA polymerase-1